MKCEVNEHGVTFRTKISNEKSLLKFCFYFVASCHRNDVHVYWSNMLLACTLFYSMCRLRCHSKKKNLKNSNLSKLNTVFYWQSALKVPRCFMKF